MLGQASTEARSLGVHAAVESPDLADELVSQADAQVRALAAHIDDEEALPEELRGVEEAGNAGADADEDESSDDEAEAETEPDGDADDESDDDDADAGAGLGDMFG